MPFALGADVLEGSTHRIGLLVAGVFLLSFAHQPLTMGLYVAATAGLVATVMIDPVAGLVAYVGSHAMEYFVIVHRSLRGRRDDAPVAKAAANALRRALIYGAYFAAIATLLAFTHGHESYSFAVLLFGALHILYDAFVWKLRRPNVAASLGVPSPAPA
jgi:hypothetical protein